MRNLNEYTDAVARLARGVLACSVFQLFNNGKRVIDNPVALNYVHNYNRADTAGVVLKLLSVKSFIRHLKFPRFYKIKKRSKIRSPLSMNAVAHLYF